MFSPKKFNYVSVLKCLRLSSDPVTLRLKKGEFISKIANKTFNTVYYLVWAEL